METNTKITNKRLFVTELEKTYDQFSFPHHLCSFPQWILAKATTKFKRLSLTRSHLLQVYQALVKLRKEKTLSHGDYAVRALSNRSFYVARFLRTFDTIVLLFNVADQPDSIVLSRVAHLELPATVVVSSIHSTRNAGYVRYSN